MADVIVIGDGPGGLSAALYLAKNGLDVVVYGEDETAMHYAHLYNYLGLPDVGGSEFQAIAREQVQEQGAELRAERVLTVEPDGEVYAASTNEGERETAKYLILSEGKKPRLAALLGIEPGEHGIEVDRTGHTSVDRVYAIGRMVRPGRSQAIISAGDGAAAALDILAREQGKDVYHDWDTPPDDDE